MQSLAKIFFISGILVASAQEAADGAINVNTNALDTNNGFTNEAITENSENYPLQGQSESVQPEGSTPVGHDSYYDNAEQYYQLYSQQFYPQYSNEYMRVPGYAGVDYNYLNSLNGGLPPYDPSYLSTDSGYYVPVFVDDEEDTNHNYAWVDQDAYNAALTEQSLQTCQINDSEENPTNLEN